MENVISAAGLMSFQIAEIFLSQFIIESPSIALNTSLVP